jgi:hypothetical protein
MPKSRFNVPEFTFKLVTHVLLGVLTYLAVQMYSDVRSLDIRIAVIESKLQCHLKGRKP